MSATAQPSLFARQAVPADIRACICVLVLKGPLEEGDRAWLRHYPQGAVGVASGTMEILVRQGFATITEITIEESGRLITRRVATATDRAKAVLL